MDKQEYLRLLSQASVNDTSKFRAVPLEGPKSKRRPPKYSHPLLEKEKLVESTVRRILPSAIADSYRIKTGSLIRVAQDPQEAISNASYIICYGHLQLRPC